MLKHSARQLMFRQRLRQLVSDLCCRDKRERAGANFTTVSVKPFVRPRIFAQQKCTLLTRNGILSVLRNRARDTVGVLCTVGGANAVKAPSSLKVRATDTAFHLSLKSQYRLPINLFWGRCPGKLRSFIGETVCLPDVFSHPRKYFYCI